MSWSEETLKSARQLGYTCCKEGNKCMYIFTDHSLQEAYEAGYAARYEEEQQATHQVEEQENEHN